MIQDVSNVSRVKPDKHLWCSWISVGEILRMTHIARGLDSDGALLLDIVVNGHILQLPSHADISIKVIQLALQMIRLCGLLNCVFIT